MVSGGFLYAADVGDFEQPREVGLSSFGMGCSAGVRVLLAYFVALVVGLEVGGRLWDIAPGAEFVTLVRRQTKWDT